MKSKIDLMMEGADNLEKSLNQIWAAQLGQELAENTHRRRLVQLDGRKFCVHDTSKYIRCGDLFFVRPEGYREIPTELKENAGGNIIVAEIKQNCGTLSLEYGVYTSYSVLIMQARHYLITGKSVVDIGCGGGELSYVAAKLGASRVIGIDMNQQKLAKARSGISINDFANVEFKQMDLDDFDPAELGQVDTAFASLAGEDLTTPYCEPPTGKPCYYRKGDTCYTNIHVTLMERFDGLSSYVALSIDDVKGWLPVDGGWGDFMREMFIAHGLKFEEICGDDIANFIFKMPQTLIKKATASESANSYCT